MKLLKPTLILLLSLFCFSSVAMMTESMWESMLDPYDTNNPNNLFHVPLTNTDIEELKHENDQAMRDMRMTETIIAGIQSTLDFIEEQKEHLTPETYNEIKQRALSELEKAQKDLYRIRLTYDTTVYFQHFGERKPLL